MRTRFSGDLAAGQKEALINVALKAFTCLMYTDESISTYGYGPFSLNYIVRKRTVSADGKLSDRFTPN